MPKLISNLMKWTEEDIKYFKKNYPTEVSTKELSKKLGRSIKAIQHKGARLGLSKSRVYTKKPRDPNRRKIIDKRYYEKHKKEIYRKRRIRLKNLKIELIKILGNKCQTCGYNKCIAALEFHHKEEGKIRHVAHIIENSSKQKALKEIEKCILLCANCHRELHNDGHMV